MKKNFYILLGLFLGGSIGAIGMYIKKEDQKKILENKVDKFKQYYNLLNEWLHLKQEKIQISDYLYNQGIHTIAIYGMGKIGTCLYNDMRNTKVKVAYVIDNSSDNIYSDFVLYNTEDTLPIVDLIIVTPVFDYDNIKAVLNSKTNIKVKSIEDILFNMTI